MILLLLIVSLNKMKNFLLIFITAIACGSLALNGEEAASPRSVFTAAQAEAGRTAYLSSCVKCHTEKLTGYDGTGEIPEAVKAFGGKIPPLAGTNAAFTPFITKWGGQTTQALNERIKVAVSGFPPPNQRIDDDLFLNLTAYILQVNGAPPGAKALTTTTAVEIRSVTSR